MALPQNNSIISFFDAPRGSAAEEACSQVVKFVGTSIELTNKRTGEVVTDAISAYNEAVWCTLIRAEQRA